MKATYRPLTDEHYARLLYRRQFVLGPRAAPRAPGWRTTPVPTGGPRDLVLATHSDLGVARVDQDGVHVTLVGYALDPDHPERTDADLAREVARTAGHPGEAVRLTARWGGRWALIVTRDGAGVAFTDAAGMRQIFHAATAEGPWLASQPEALASALGLEVSARGRAFLASGYVAREPEWFWPNGSSPYDGVRRLLPNHWLTLPDARVERFWPREAIAPLPFDQAVTRGAALLRGTVAAAVRRFPLAVPITAGFDSRGLLAASREWAAQIYYYTMRYDRYGAGHYDLRIARRLARHLGIHHRVIRCPAVAEPHFAKLYAASVHPAPAEPGAIADGLFADYPDDRVCVVGHAAEIARCGDYFRMEYYPREPITAERVAHYTRMWDTPYAAEEYAPWLAGAREVERATGVRILDLMHWEQWVGNWAADGEAQWDIVMERLPAYVNRELLTTLLAVDVARREKPEFELTRALIGRLWPDALGVPINPAPLELKELVRGALRLARLEAPVLSLYHRLKGDAPGPHA